MFRYIRDIFTLTQTTPSLSILWVYLLLPFNLSSSDDSKRVYLDKLAPFVIPYRPKTPMRHNLKACKVCKDCGLNYAKLVAGTSTSNTTKDNNLTHIFVEKPIHRQPTKDPIPCHNRPLKDSRWSRRQTIDSPSNGASDWTWSSFRVIDSILHRSLLSRATSRPVVVWASRRIQTSMTTCRVDEVWISRRNYAYQHYSPIES